MKIRDVISTMFAGLRPKSPFGGFRGLSWVGLFLLLLLTSCNPDDEICQPNPTQHVLLVYMGGDNNLSSETYQKIEAIRSGWNASAGDRIIIYQDAANAAPTLTEIVKQNGVNKLNTIKTYPEENSASATVFARVVAEVKALYPLSGGRGLMACWSSPTHRAGYRTAHSINPAPSSLMETMK